LIVLPRGKGVMRSTDHEGWHGDLRRIKLWGGAELVHKAASWSPEHSSQFARFRVAGQNRVPKRLEGTRDQELLFGPESIPPLQRGTSQTHFALGLHDVCLRPSALGETQALVPRRPQHQLRDLLWM